MNPYEVLGLAPTATLDDAERAYRDLLRIHHPDLHRGGSDDEVTAAELRTRALNTAIDRIRTERSPSRRRRGTSATTAPAYTPTATMTAPRPTSRGDDAVVVCCPTCGEPFTGAHAFRAHLRQTHGVRVTAPRRPGVTPPSRSLAVLVPVNAVAALVAGVVTANVAQDPRLAWWVFLLALAPVLIRLVSGSSRL